MTYEEAVKKALTVRWKTETCSQGEKCWCRLIVPEKKIEDDNGNEIVIASSGDIKKEYAEHIVALHNWYMLHSVVIL
jgi:hypothetical protein